MMREIVYIVVCEYAVNPEDSRYHIVGAYSSKKEAEKALNQHLQAPAHNKRDTDGVITYFPSEGRIYQENVK